MEVTSILDATGEVLPPVPVEKHPECHNKEEVTPVHYGVHGYVWYLSKYYDKSHDVCDGE